MSKEVEQAIEIHKRLDEKFGYKSPNKFWPESLIEYYEQQEKEKNENWKKKIF